MTFHKSDPANIGTARWLYGRVARRPYNVYTVSVAGASHEWWRHSSMFSVGRVMSHGMSVTVIESLVTGFIVKSMLCRCAMLGPLVAHVRGYALFFSCSCSCLLANAESILVIVMFAFNLQRPRLLASDGSSALQLGIWYNCRSRWFMWPPRLKPVT